VVTLLLGNPPSACGATKSARAVGDLILHRFFTYSRSHPPSDVPALSWPGAHRYYKRQPL